MTAASDRIIEIYRRHALAWTSARGSVLSEGVWIEPFLAAIPLGGTILDIGCGPGEPIASHIVSRGYTVTGVDGSPEMIELFRKNLPDQTAILMDMRLLNLGRLFSGLIAWDSFFHLTPSDQRTMFPVFREHAERGASLLFTSGPAFGEAVGILEGEPLYHGSLDQEEYQQLLDQNDFDILDHVIEDPRCGRHTVWLARRR